MQTDKSFNEAKRMYVEQYGSALVMNTYLKIALLSLSLVAVRECPVDRRK
jgi:hypothetical protein